MLTIGDTYQFTLRQTYLGQVIENVLHAKLLAVPGTPLTTFATFMTDWITAVHALQSNALTYTDWKAVQVAGAGVTYSTTSCLPTGGDEYAGVLTAQAGTLSGEALPATDCGLIDLGTGLRGRSYRGRKFVAGITEGIQNGGTIAAGTVTSVQATINTFFAKYGVGGSDTTLRWGIFSLDIASGCKTQPIVVAGRVRRQRVHLSAANAAGALNGVTVALLDADVHTLHRRLPGVGR